MVAGRPTKSSKTTIKKVSIKNSSSVAPVSATEKLKKNQVRKQRGKNGGARPGAGRPKHSKNPATIEREEAMRQFRERVAGNISKLLNSQIDLATGEKYLMRTRGKKTTIIDDPEIIRQYIDGDLDIEKDEYYFMTTRPASNSALDSLLNRTFGKVTDSIDLKAEVDTNVNVNVSEVSTEDLERMVNDYLTGKKRG